jgi:hypothetical protein
MNDCSSLRLGKVENVVEIAKILGFGCKYNWYLYLLNHQYLYFRDSFFQGFGATSVFFLFQPTKKSQRKSRWRLWLSVVTLDTNTQRTCIEMHTKFVCELVLCLHSSIPLMLLLGRASP